MTNLMEGIIPDKQSLLNSITRQAVHVINFPISTRASSGTISHQPKVTRYVGALILLAHLAILAIAVIVSHHPAPVAYAPDRVIDLMDIADMTPPPQSQPQKPSNPVPVPDSQRMQVKDETKPAQPLSSAEPAPAANADSGTINYLPQSDIEVAPFIEGKIYKSRIVYPPIAQKMGIEAVVSLELFIDQNGIVRQVVVKKDPGNGFAEAAVAALQGIQVKPATAGGSPVAVRWRFNLRFTLK